MAEVLDYSLEFKLQSGYYDYSRTNNIVKNTKSLSLPAKGWILSLTFFYKDGFGIK